MNLLRVAARVAAAPADLMVLTFEMPGDQDWDADLWERLGVGGDWENIGKAFYNAGATVDDTEDITVEFDPKDEPAVRGIIDDARAGKYGPDVQAYWSQASEVST